MHVCAQRHGRRKFDLTQAQRERERERGREMLTFSCAPGNPEIALLGGVHFDEDGLQRHMSAVPPKGGTRA